MTTVYRSGSVTGKVRLPLMLAVAAPAVGCLGDQPHAMLPDQRAQALLDDVRQRSYREWAAPPLPDGEPRRQKAAGPHGAFVEVFLDPTLEGATRADMTLEAWPVGSTAVAEGYDDEATDAVALYNIARKTEDGWVWAQLDGDERGIDSGRPDDCVSCHGNGMDRIFSAVLPEVEDE